jgi:hypothetical protein
VKAPAHSTIRDLLRASLRLAGKPASLQSSAYGVGDGSSGRPLSVPPKICDPSCRHWSSPGVTLAGLEPGSLVLPTPPRLLTSELRDRSSLSLGHCSVPLVSRSLPRWVPVAVAWSGDECCVGFHRWSGARDSDAREGGGGGRCGEPPPRLGRTRCGAVCGCGAGLCCRCAVAVRVRGCAVAVQVRAFRSRASTSSGAGAVAVSDADAVCGAVADRGRCTVVVAVTIHATVAVAVHAHLTVVTRRLHET